MITCCFLKRKMSEKVVILGTGDYGLALGQRLIDYGFRVVFGSRQPDSYYLKEYFESSDPASYSVTSISDAWSQSNRFVFFAVPAWTHEQIAEELGKTESRSNQAESKIVIEISNLIESQSHVKESNAGKLQTLLQKNLKQKVNVVKGFNLTSAYSISGPEFFSKRELTTSQAIPIAGDDTESKRAVIDLCHRIGYNCHDTGSLSQSALKLELINVSSFDDWYYPSFYSIVFLVFNWIAIFTNYYLFPKKPITFDQYVRDFSVLSHTNKCLAFTSLQILAFVYFTSCLAYIYQLKNTTKHKRFPKYLDSLLKARKHYGLWAFFFATLHMICSIFIMNPFYLADWYRKPDQFSSLSILTVRSEVTLLLGILAYVLLVILALTSVKAIGNGLNWAEWRFVQTKLGILSLSLATVHDFVMYMRMYNDRANLTFVYLITRMKLIALYFPILVLVMRLVFSYFTPISQRLDRIRNLPAVDQKKKN